MSIAILSGLGGTTHNHSALVSSQTEYYNAVYMELPLKSILKLFHDTLLSHMPHWLLVCFQVRLKALVATYKALYVTHLSYSWSRLSLIVSTYPIESHLLQNVTW